MKKPLPIDVDDFKKLITSGYYYVDKTLFIKELLDKKGDVNLFTRPRSLSRYKLNLHIPKGTGKACLNSIRWLARG